MIMRLGEIWEVVKGVAKIIGGGDNAAGYIPPAPKGSPRPQPVSPATARADQKLVKRTLYQMTVTTNVALQAKNRVLTDEQVDKLKQVDQLLCEAETILGLEADVHSGYRCPELNGATVGSSTRSQHMLCEATDFCPKGQASAEQIEAAFQALWKAGREGKIKFGQLIFERAQRSYGTVIWIHLSLGQPWREAARCGQVLRMEAGPDGKPVYKLIATI